MMHSTMEVSPCAFSGRGLHHGAMAAHSLLEFGNRRPCQAFGAGQRKALAACLKNDKLEYSGAKRDGTAHLHLLLFAGSFTSAPVSCIRNRKRQSPCNGVVCAAQNQPGESSDEKENEGEPVNDPSDSSNNVDPASQNSDWRAFRARLIAYEQAANQEQRQQEQQPSTSESDAPKPDSTSTSLGPRWAHPILKPEAGCVLIATDKLDELSIFERTVIILLSAGSNKGNDGPFGLILNRPLPHVLKDIRPQDQALAEAFGESQVHFGGPLVSDLILLLQGASARTGYQEVVPGIFYSSADGLNHAVNMINEKASTPQDFRFFFGYAGWTTGQLEREVEDGYWCVAACSTNLFISSSAANLWEEVLKLMGGQYAELSKKPKKRWFK